MPRLRQLLGLVGQTVGIFGTCLSLFTSIEPLITLSNWAKLLIDAWIFYTEAFWQTVFGWFFLFEVEPAIFPMLSAAVFMLLIGLTSTRSYRNLINGGSLSDTYVNDFEPAPRLDYWLTLFIVACIQSTILLRGYIDLFTIIEDGDFQFTGEVCIGFVIALVGIMMGVNATIGGLLSGDRFFFSKKEKYLWWVLCAVVPALILFSPPSEEFPLEIKANLSLRLYGFESLFIAPAVAFLIADTRLLLSRTVLAATGLILLVVLNYISVYQNEIRALTQ